MSEPKTGRPEMRALQAAVFANKQAKGFNTTDVPLELCLLQGEVAELFDAWRRHHPNVGEELADVMIYVLGLAGILNIDLAAEVVAKMQVNAARKYVRDGAAVWTKGAS